MICQHLPCPKYSTRHVPEVSAQIDNLPRTQPSQHTHGTEGKPLDALVGTLICISKLLFPGAQIIHLRNDFGDEFLDTTQFHLDRLELLAGLDGGPILCVGANINVEFDVAVEGTRDC